MTRNDSASDPPIWSLRTRHTGPMAKGTRAIQLLEQSDVVFCIHEYAVDRADISYGEAVASALGVSSDELFKTLVATVDGSPVVAIIPVSRHLAMKKLARAVGGKHASMAEPAEAQRLTGYVVGGISPLGQRRSMPTFLDSSADNFESILLSAGRRGLQVEMAPDDLVSLTDCTMAHIST